MPVWQGAAFAAGELRAAIRLQAVMSEKRAQSCDLGSQDGFPCTFHESL